MQPSSSTNVPDDGPSQHGASLNSFLPPTQDSKEAQHIVSRPGAIHSSHEHTRSRMYATSTTEPSSSSNSNTLVDEEFNEAMAEKWPAPSHAGTEPEPNEPCFVLIGTRPLAGTVAERPSKTVPQAPNDNLANGTMIEPSFASGLPQFSHEEVGQPSELLCLPELAMPEVHHFSSTRSHTIVGSTLQDTNTGLWSGPTLAGSMFDETSTDLYLGLDLEQAAMRELTLTTTKLAPTPPPLSEGCPSPTAFSGQSPNSLSN